MKYVIHAPMGILLTKKIMLLFLVIKHVKLVLMKNVQNVMILKIYAHLVIVDIIYQVIPMIKKNVQNVLWLIAKNVVEH